MRFPAQLYLTIQLARQTYFCLQVNKVRVRLTTLRYATFRSRWRVGGFLLLTSMTWNILFFTIFYILFNFIYLSRLAIKRRYFPYTSSRPKWVKRMKWRDLILILVCKNKWMYRRYIIILNFPNFYPNKIDYKSCFKNHRDLWDFSTPLYFATLRFVSVEMTCWGLSFANCYDVNYFIFYAIFKLIF